VRLFETSIAHINEKYYILERQIKNRNKLFAIKKGAKDFDTGTNFDHNGSLG
jgi:hypothetical protein